MAALHGLASDNVRKTRPISWLKAARKDFERFGQAAQNECLDALSIAAECAGCKTAVRCWQWSL